KLAARGKLERRCRAAWVAQLLAAASRALRTRRHVMPHDGRPQQVEAQDVIREIGAKLGSNRFCDLDGRKRDAALSNRLAGERRRRNLARAFAVEHPLD